MGKSSLLEAYLSCSEIAFYRTPLQDSKRKLGVRGLWPADRKLFEWAYGSNLIL